MTWIVDYILAQQGWEVVSIFYLVLIFVGVGCVVSFRVMNSRRWPWKVSIIDNLSGRGYSEALEDRARLVRFGDSGEELYALKKTGKHRVGYGKRIGKNKIGFAVGEDGYWYNFGYGDINKTLLELGMNPIDRNVRFASSSVRKGVDNRYQQKSFLEKYGAMIMGGIIIVTLIIFAINNYLDWEHRKQAKSLDLEYLKLQKEVVEKQGQILGSIDRVASGGSGIVPAGNG